MSFYSFFKKKKSKSIDHKAVSSLPTTEYLVTAPEKEREKYKTLSFDMLKYKVLAPVNIDIDYVIQTRGLGVSIYRAVETEKYVFYNYGWSSIHLILRQSKANRNEVCYFGLLDSYDHVFFNGYIFYKYSVGRDNVDLGCVDPETGRHIRCEILGKKTYLRGSFVTCQDDVCGLKVKNDQLEVKVKRTKTDCVDNDPLDLDTTYYIYITFDNEQFYVERVFSDTDQDKTILKVEFL